MNLMDLLQQAGGGDSVGKLADSVGLGSDDTEKLIAALSPALVTGIKKQAGAGGGFEALQSALATGDHKRYLEQPELMASSATRDDGNKILGHLFGSKKVSRKVAARASDQTGIDASLIKKALPLVAGLAMGALSKKTDAGRDVSTGGGLGGLLGGLLGDDDGFGVDDLLGMAKKLF